MSSSDNEAMRAQSVLDAVIRYRGITVSLLSTFGRTLKSGGHSETLSDYEAGWQNVKKRLLEYEERRAAKLQKGFDAITKSAGLDAHSASEKHIDEREARVQQLEHTIKEQQAAIGILEEKLLSEKRDKDYVSTKLSSKVIEMAALRKTINSRNTRSKMQHKTNTQQAERESLLEEIQYLSRALQEESQATGAARADAREIFEDLKLAYREMRLLRNDSTYDGQTLHYPMTKLEHAQDAKDALEPKVQVQTNAESQAVLATAVKKEQPANSFKRLTTALDHHHDLLDFKNAAIQELEQRLAGVKFIVSCKDRIIKKWERALGTCYAELERLQESGDKVADIIEVDTSLIFDDDNAGYATSIRTVIGHQDVINALRADALAQARAYIASLEAQIEQLDGDAVEVDTSLGHGEVSMS